jgi:hypothetical protein
VRFSFYHTPIFTVVWAIFLCGPLGLCPISLISSLHAPVSTIYFEANVKILVVMMIHILTLLIRDYDSVQKASTQKWVRSALYHYLFVAARCCMTKVESFKGEAKCARRRQSSKLENSILNELGFGKLNLKNVKQYVG